MSVCKVHTNSVPASAILHGLAVSIVAVANLRRRAYIVPSDAWMNSQDCVPTGMRGAWGLRAATVKTAAPVNPPVSVPVASVFAKRPASWH